MINAKYKANKEMGYSGSRTSVSISAKGVSKNYNTGTSRCVVAVNNVDFFAKSGETVSIVGESGSGKTTLAKLLVGFIRPNAGEVLFADKPLNLMSKNEEILFRRKVQFIPQYPDLALDPTWYIYDSIAEPLRLQHLIRSKKEELDVVRSACERFGLSTDQLRRKPRSISGGEVQRAVFARAMVLKPEMLIADEPTSMLDPSTQAMIVRMMLEAQKEDSFGLVFITHDLSLAKIASSKVFVMLSGRIIEEGPSEEVLTKPLHPYTMLLVSNSIAENENQTAMPCPFYNSCNQHLEVCSRSPPPELDLGRGRKTRCWLYAKP